MEGKLCFEIEWANLMVGRKFAVVACFTLYLGAISEYKPSPGEGRFNGRFFALQVWGAYIWRGYSVQYSMERKSTKRRLNRP